MIIKSIKLENFQCYHGTNNYFDFTEGLNVIIGDNATGKSKLYDAFTWALYDECFETESRKPKRTPELKSKLIADQAKHLTSVGDAVKTEVTLTFYKNTSRGEEEYIVKRSYEIVKKGEKEWQEPLKSKLEVLKRELPLNARPIDEDAQAFIYRSLLPKDIRPYMWFQGEQVDDLIDFENKEALSRAINILSDISNFDKYDTEAKRLAEVATKEYKAEYNRLGNDKEKFERLQKGKSSKEQEILNLKEEKSEAERNLAFADAKLQQLIGQVDDAKQISTFRERTENLERQIKQAQDDIDKRKTQSNKFLFTKQWVLRNVGHLIGAYEQQFDVYEQIRSKREAEKEAEQKAASALDEKLENVFRARLPKGNPEPIYLKRMLNEEHCLICDREAKRDTEAWLKIKALLEEAAPQKVTKDEPITEHNFQPAFKSLYQNALRLQDNIEGVDNSIQQETQVIQQLFDTIKDLKIQYNEANDVLEGLVSGSNISLDKSNNITKDFQEYTQKVRQYEASKTQKESKIQNVEKELRDIETNLKALTRGKMPASLEEKKRLLDDFKIIAKSTRDRVFDGLIKQLETEANRHFAAMTVGNRGTKGYIKLVNKDGYYMPKNVDAYGNELPQINDSNIILIKMAVIMAIISAKKSSNATDLYTLITDAPSSKFTDNYTIGFCKTVSETYGQSIIMSKDFHTNLVLRDRLLDSNEVPKLGNVYLITPSVSEENRSDRNNLATKIEKIK
jgi:DNA sulfur modification protein DndD